MTFYFSFQDWCFLLGRFFYIINSILQSTLLFYFLLSLSSYSFQSCGILGLQSSYWKICSCLKKYFSTDYFITFFFFPPTSSAFCVQEEASLFIVTSLGGHLIIPHCDGIRKLFLMSWERGNVVKQLYPLSHISARESLGWVHPYHKGFNGFRILIDLHLRLFRWVQASILPLLFFEMLSVLCYRTWLGDNQSGCAWAAAEARSSKMVPQPFFWASKSLISSILQWLKKLSRVSTQKRHDFSL